MSKLYSQLCYSTGVFPLGWFVSSIDHLTTLACESTLWKSKFIQLAHRDFMVTSKWVGMWSLKYESTRRLNTLQLGSRIRIRFPNGSMIACLWSIGAHFLTGRLLQQILITHYYRGSYLTHRHIFFHAHSWYIIPIIITFASYICIIRHYEADGLYSPPPE